MVFFYFSLQLQDLWEVFHDELFDLSPYEHPWRPQRFQMRRLWYWQQIQRRFENPFENAWSGWYEVFPLLRIVWKKVQFPQCGIFKIFVSLRFHVKSILENLEVPKLPFLPSLGLWILFIWWIPAFKKCKKSVNSNFRASKCVKMADFALQEF